MRRQSPAHKREKLVDSFSEKVTEVTSQNQVKLCPVVKKSRNIEAGINGNKLVPARCLMQSGSTDAC